MSPSVIFYTCLFTLEDVPIIKNNYIKIFLMWFASVVKTKSIGKDDLFVLITDRFTADYLKTYTTFIQLAKKGEIEVYTFINKQPKTLMEGFMWRYNVLTDEFLEAQKRDMIFYCDIDILLAKSIKIITDQVMPNSVLVHQENFPLTNKPYGEGITQEEMQEICKLISKPKGLSCGKFIISGNKLILEIFKKINDYHEKNQEQKIKLQNYEQPLFNRAIYTELYENKITIGTLDVFCGTFNDVSILSQNCVFFDCCGRPGDNDEHMEKMINLFCYFY